MASPITRRTVRNATVAGAVAIGALVLPAAPALAQPVTVPGVGTFEVPDLPAIPNLPGAPAAPGAPAPFVAPTTTAAQQAAQAAESKVGSPYVYGAAGPDAFDCSGLVQWAFKQAGISVPRTSEAQASAGSPVSQGDLQVGDIITFPSPELDEPSVTHRVRSITPTASGFDIETRGDANDESEYWSADHDELLGRKVARLPAIGGIVARVGRLRAVLAGLALALVLGAVVAARATRRGGAVSPQPAAGPG